MGIAMEKWNSAMRIVLTEIEIEEAWERVLRPKMLYNQKQIRPKHDAAAPDNGTERENTSGGARKD